MAWRMVWRPVALALLALACAAALPAPGRACSCADVSVPSDVVFIGRAVVVVRGPWARERLRALDHDSGSRIALLQVEAMWQGQPRPFFIVSGGTGQGDCGIPFTPGATYLIHGLRREHGLFHTNVCLGSRQMDALPGSHGLALG